MSVEEQFRQRLNEVASYLRSLRALEESRRTKISYRMSATFAASRAASFIMIYNCVEFAVREAIVATRAEITREAPQYIELNAYWRQEIVKVNFRRRLEQGGEHSKLLSDFVDFIPGRVNWRDKLRDLPFSGNIDHQSLIEFAKKIGEVSWKPPQHTLGGSDLVLIRTTRNALAHGDDTFENVGSAYQATDLLEKIPRIKKFVGSFIRMIERHQSQRKYRLANRR
jgi:hypothetical protein